MSKKIILIIIAIIVLVGASYLIYQPASKPNLAVDARNAAYIIEGEEVTLVNGRAEKEIVPGSATKIITQYFGNEARADFNGDGAEDVVFLLTQNSGGSGTFYYVAVALSLKNGYKGTNAILLGDRIAPQTTEFRNEEIIVNYADRNPGEPMTTRPSLGVSRYFKVSSGQLVEVPKNNTGTTIPADKILNLSNQGLKSIPSFVFNQTKIEELNVSYNLLTGAIQAEIRRLSNLKVLNASNNFLTGVPAEIGQLQKLEVLDLSNNQLTGLPNELGNLKNLKSFNLSGNQYSQQDLDYIRSKLPSAVNIITD